MKTIFLLLLIAAMIIAPAYAGARYEGGTPTIGPSKSDKQLLDRTPGLFLAVTEGPNTGLYWGGRTPTPRPGQAARMMSTAKATLVTGGGSPGAYLLSGFRVNRGLPLRWVLKNDAYLAGEGLAAGAVQSAIISAANTWDNATPQNLFADSSLVTLNPTIAVTCNRQNSISFAPSRSVCMATTRTFYDSNKVDGFGGVVDSDIIFNTNYKWCTSGPVGNDFQSIVLHEMGHTLGLGDLYGKSQFALDGRQVMHAYTGVKRTLGNGDLAGIARLYG